MVKVGKKAKAADTEVAENVNSLLSLRDRLQKAAKGVHISVMSDSKITERNEFVETPSYDLNRILSGDLRKGIAKKTFVLFVAPEHSGKSSFSALLAANAQKKYGMKIIVIDTEGGWSNDFVKRWGLNPDDILYCYTPWVEEVKTILANIIASKEENLCIILDSIGGLDQSKIYDDAVKGDPKADQGGLARALKPAYKMIANIVKQQDSICIGAGHFYGSPGGAMYGNPDEIGGGKYLKLAADIVVSLKKSKLYDVSGNKEVVGSKLKGITLKNRLYPPYNECEVDIDFTNGVNRFAGLLDIALEAEIINLTGNTYSYINDKGVEYKCVAEKNVQAKILEPCEDEIVDKLNEYVKQHGFSTINDDIKEQMKEIEEEMKEHKDEEEEVTAA